MEKILVSDLGQLKKADVQLGDLTVLVGPQASGKSIFLQLVKLTLDYQQIMNTIRQQGFDWQHDQGRFLALYFGEGMQSLWTKQTIVKVDDKVFDLASILQSKGKKGQVEKLFLIPAQRVITLRSGWPRPFMDYETGDPYVVKQFSEKLRLLMEAGLGGGKNAIFPQEGRMNKELRDAINQSIFANAEARLDNSNVRKRILLKINENELPFMVWSAGQREFMPLLLGLYTLMPSAGASKSRGMDWIVIEEPEMGLHPQAISALLIVILELLHRGYRIIVSTHSPQVLELVWAVRMLAELKSSPETVLSLFHLRKTKYLEEMACAVLQKNYKTYYFNRQSNGVYTSDISTLDPNDMDDAVADWGGLTAFSTRVSQIVSRAVREHEE